MPNELNQVPFFVDLAFLAVFFTALALFYRAINRNRGAYLGFSFSLDSSSGKSARLLSKEQHDASTNALFDSTVHHFDRVHVLQ